MRQSVYFTLCAIFYSVTSFSQSSRTSYFNQLNGLEYVEAKRIAGLEKDSLLRIEMIKLADMLFYEGQIDRRTFQLCDSMISSKRIDLLVLTNLSNGYKCLFYDDLKGTAYKYFYKAYQYAKESENAELVKTSLLGLLKYYNYEIAQNSEAHEPYLRHYESMQSTRVDSLWVCIYKVIFLSKTFVPLSQKYFNLIDVLQAYEQKLPATSSMLAHIYYETALRYELESDIGKAITYYHKTIEQSKRYPFLRYNRFFSAIKLMRIQTNRRNFDSARYHLTQAKSEIDQSDTVRSIYYMNLYGSFLLRAEQKYDTAFNLLWDAYQKEFQLDFRRNTLEINRLNVELDTQEKENANLRLRQGRIWWMAAVAGFALLAAASYFAYTHQLSKNRIQEKEKEVQNMKLEMLLKEHEMVGIDAMLEGQEKERQRLAGELHDHLGSLLAAIKFHFASMKLKSDASEEIKNTDALLEEAYQKVRSIAHARNAGMNSSEGLLPAIHLFATKASVLNRLKIEVEEHGMNERMDNSLELLVFRMVQELIANVIKHAQATEIIIHLTKHERALNVMVEDNGIGFHVAQVKPGETMGLYVIQKKVESLGGNVTIDSIPGRGTSIIIDIPLT
jgi:signal transduction histidine kinase